jgi:MFS family permease
LIGALLGGLCTGLLNVVFGVELQEVVPQSWMALAMSVNESLLLLAPGIGIALGGVIGSLVSVRFAFGVSAASSLVVAAFGLAALASAQAAELSPARDVPLGPADDRADRGDTTTESRSHTPA